MDAACEQSELVPEKSESRYSWISNATDCESASLVIEIRNGTYPYCSSGP